MRLPVIAAAIILPLALAACQSDTPRQLADGSWTFCKDGDMACQDTSVAAKKSPVKAKKAHKKVVKEVKEEVKKAK